jgi:hypothetical protein
MLPVEILTLPPLLSKPACLTTPYPVATSHILMLLSLEAETRKSPEGMKQIEEML